MIEQQLILLNDDFIAQNVNFKEKFGNLVFVSKFRTIREFSEFRNRLRIGDMIHCFTGMRVRGSKARKLGDGLIVNKIIIHFKSMPETIEEAKRLKIAKLNESWYSCSKKDGFRSYNEFVNFFKKAKEEKLKYILFDFIEIYTKDITDYLQQKLEA